MLHALIVKRPTLLSLRRRTALWRL